MSEKSDLSAPRAPERMEQTNVRDKDEALLIKRCQEGDEYCFEKLFQKYQRRTYVLAYNILNDYELAKDVVQEAFVRVFRNICRFDASKNFYTWLYQIVVNLSIDFLRKRSNSKAASLEDLGDLAMAKGRGDRRPQGPVGSVSRKETSDRVRQVLNLLPPKYKVVLTLRDIEGFSSEEIAQVVQAKNSTIRWRIHQARKMFKALWNGEGADVKQYLDGSEDDDL